MHTKEWRIFASIIMLALTLFGVFLLLDIQALQGQIDDKKTNEALAGRDYIVMIGEVDDHAYWNLVRDGAESYAKNHQMYVQYLGPENPDPEQQRELLRKAMDIKPDGIIVQSVTGSFIPLINQAMNEGIPVVTVDSDQPDSNRISYVGTDNYAMGVAMAEDVLANVDQIEAGIITGTATNHHHQLRVAGIKDTLTSDKSANIVSTAVSNIKRINAREKTYQMLQRYPEINVLFGISALDVIGIVEAMEALNRDDIYVVGFDTLTENMQLLSDEKVATLVSQQPYQMGVKSMDVMRSIINGDNVEALIHTDSRLVKDVHHP